MEMTKIWKCKSCGMTLEELVPGCVPQCCGELMQECVPGTTDGAKEKHVPVWESSDSCTKVTVGSVPHPMTEEHYIVWIELISPTGRVCRQYLKPGEAPEAVFCHRPVPGTVIREYCNLHGCWIAEMKNRINP